MRAGVGQNIEDVLNHPVEGEWIKTLRLPSNFLNAVDLDNYDNVTLLLDAGLIPRNHHADSFLYKTEVIHLRDMA